MGHSDWRRYASAREVRRKVAGSRRATFGRSLRFEPLEGRLLLASDFGDAPARYPTLLANNGARHEAVGPTLGTQRDTEADAIASALANGDDADPVGGPDDEDGVTFGAIRVGQLGATTTVNVQNAPSGARLDAWLDFNGDGNWSGSLERIAAGVVVHDGDNILTFDVPGDASPGQRFARFRLSTSGGLGPLGAAADGEVEDYAVTISPAQATVGAFGPKHVISSTDPALSVSSPFDVVAIDFDQDGDMDAVSTSSSNGRLILHENQGSGNFANYVIGDVIVLGDLNAADLDGDGDLDLVSDSRNDNSVFWFEHTSGHTFVQHTAWTAGSVTSSDVADVDGDGDIDIVAQASSPLKMAWLENDGHGSFTAHEWTSVDADTIVVQDFNGDGRPDIVATSDLDNKVYLWQNNGGVFTVTTIANLTNPRSLSVADLDGDGDVDIIADREATPYQIVVLENGGLANFTQHQFTITDTQVRMGVRAADLDGDGDLDLFTDRTTWYRNDGNLRFTAVPSSGGGLVAADMDGDGDLDLLDLPTFNTVAWFENTTSGVSVTASPATIDEYAPLAGQFTFTRRSLSLDPLTVMFTVSGTATLGTDYNMAGATPSGGQWSVTFEAGQTTAVVTVIPVADGVLESLETISFVLQAGPTIAVEPPVSATINLTGNNDPSDWGDAPTTFVTLGAANGPRHGAVGPRLGSTRDIESDGQPSTAADADDTNEAGDDGITFGTIRPGMASASVTLNVENAPNGARVTAWIDFDNDGTFSGALERIIADAAVVNGDNLLTFQVPAGALVGNTVARFRIRTDSGPLAPIGPATDGEVEDCAVTIAPIVTTVVPGDYPQNLTSTTGGVVGVLAVDLDRDGDIDALTASSNNDTVAWNENDGLGHFTQRIITTTADGAGSISAADMDGDGDIDIVVACGTAGTIQIYYNGGNQTFTTTTIASPPASGSVFIADIDRDGRLDILTGGANDYFGFLAQTSPGVFTPFTISTGFFTSPRSVYAADVDSDGDTDLLAAYWFDDSLFWFENQGPTTFVAHEVPNSFLDGAAAVYAVDLDRDGDTDIIGAGEIGYTLYWFENNGSQVFTRRTIASNVAGTSVQVADLDGDSDYDVLLALKSSGRFEWYKNNGSQAFTVQTIDATAPGAYSLYPADMDGDGDLDVLTQTTSGAVVWYQSAQTSLTLATSAPTVLEDSLTPVVFTFTRSAALTGSLTVPFTVGGTAQFGTDYTVSGATTFTATSGTVTFAPGASTTQVSITPVVDLLLEADKTVTLTALPGATYSIVAPGAATTTIVEHSVADFGDAPTPYPTTRAQNGARHAATGPMLGASRDSEIDGQPLTGATGDDSIGSADEDGVMFGTPQAGQLGALVTVNVQNAPAGARLDAWIDFDGDGSWGGPLEQIAINLPVVEGANQIKFDMPSGARLGTAYARFRLSTVGGLTPTGMTSDGEVEDYAVTILPPHTASGYFSEAHVVNGSVSFAGGLAMAADIDRDGDMDLLDMVPLNEIVWHLNDGNQNFQTQVVVGTRQGLAYVTAVDLDRDGDLDVIATATNFNPGASNFITWYENNGSLGFVEHTAATSTTLQFSNVQIADLDGDGDLDMVASGSMGSFGSNLGFVAVYINDGHQGFTGQTIVSGANVARAFAVADINRDGRIDFITGNLVWYENLGTGAFASHSLSGNPTAAAAVATDLDLDGDIDVVYASSGGSSIAWMEQRPGLTFLHRTIIFIPNGQVRSLQVADFDGDGDNDIAWSNVSSGITGLNVNNGSQVFTYRTLAVGQPSFTVYAADMDRDGDLDVVAASYGNYLAWLENLDTVPPQGDYDRNGVVDSSDYGVWRTTFGSTADLRANGNSNTSIDAGDYVLWRKNVATPAAASGAATSLVAAPAESNEQAPIVSRALAQTSTSMDEAVVNHPVAPRPIDFAILAFQESAATRVTKSDGPVLRPFSPASSYLHSLDALMSDRNVSSRLDGAHDDQASSLFYLRASRRMRSAMDSQELSEDAVCAVFDAFGEDSSLPSDLR